MAQVVLNIPDAAMPRVVDALSAVAGLPATPANAKTGLIQMLKQQVRQHEIMSTVEAIDIT